MLRAREPQYLAYAMISALILLVLCLAVLIYELSRDSFDGFFIASVVVIAFSLAALVFAGILWKGSEPRSRHEVPESKERRWRWWPKPVQLTKKSRQEADHRVGESLVSVLDQTGRAEVENLLAHDDYIQAVRRVRELTGLRLADARRLVDSLKT